MGGAAERVQKGDFVVSSVKHKMHGNDDIETCKHFVFRVVGEKNNFRYAKQTPLTYVHDSCFVAL